MIGVHRGSEGALVSFYAPSRRQRMARRRLVAVLSVVGIALAGMVVGMLSPSRAGAPLTGAFSYLSE